jgi:SNF family Na+-dependent transporter
MACSTCNKKKNVKLKQSLNSNENGDFSELVANATTTQAIFSGRLGKFFFFLILLVCALTPIINLAAAYVFYIAVYGKNTKKQKNVTEHTNTDETE